MKTHTSSFKEQIKLMGKEIDSRITFGDTVLGKDDLNAVTPSYQGAILKSVMKQLDIDSNVEIPIGTILKYEFGLKVNGEYEYINYGNYVVYSIEKQEDTNSYKITCYDKLLYSMLDYVKLPITYPISIRDYINSLSTALGLKFANKSGTFANYNKQIQADLYDGLGYTFRDILDELAQVTASTICLNNNDELEIRYITETNDTIDEEFLKDVNVNFGEKFGEVNTIVLSRSGDSDSVYYPSVLPANPYEIKISDNQIMNGNDRADFLPDIYNKLNGLEFYTNDFVSTGICYYDLCDRYSVKVGDTTYSCVMFNDEVLVTQGLEENVYTELPEQTETDYKHASKDDRMINQVYIIAKKNEAEILAVVNTTKQIEKEINPTKDESGSSITIEDASNNPLTYLEIEGKSTQATRSGKNNFDEEKAKKSSNYTANTSIGSNWYTLTIDLLPNTEYTITRFANNVSTNGVFDLQFYLYEDTKNPLFYVNNATAETVMNRKTVTFTTRESGKIYLAHKYGNDERLTNLFNNIDIQIEKGNISTEYEQYGVMPSPDFPSEIESVGYENLYKIPETETKNGIKLTNNGNGTFNITGTATANTSLYIAIPLKESKIDSGIYTISCKSKGYTAQLDLYGTSWLVTPLYRAHSEDKLNATATINITSDVTTVRCIIYIPSGKTINLTNETIQLEKGSVAHPIIPYGKYGVEVKTIGENILNNTKYELGGWATGGIKYDATDIYRFNEPIEVIGGETLYFSKRLCLYFDVSGSDTTNNLVKVVPQNATKVYLRCFAGDFANFNPKDYMISRTPITEIKSYQERTSVIVLNEPLRSLPNGVKDIAYIRNNKLYVDRYVGSIVLNGSESWALSSGESIPYIYLPDIKKTTSNNIVANILSSHYLPMQRSGITEGHIAVSTQGNVVLYDTANGTTVDNFKNWLSTNNVQVDYELATPITEEIGEIQMPSTFKGVNHISTTDKLEPIINLTYVRDTVIADYVENHVTELKLTENEIKVSVKDTNKKLTDLEKIEEEHYSELVLKSDQISSTVSKKIGSDEVVSSINQSAEQIELKGNRVVIESDNFDLTADGEITATAGQIAGFSINKNGFTYLLKPKKDYTQTDIDKLSAYIYQGGSLTDSEKQLYDANNDGVLNLQDIQMMSWTIVNNISNTLPGKFQIGIPKVGDNPYIIDFGLYNGFGELLNGFTYNKATFVDTKINGDLTVTGSKNRMVKVGNKNVLLNAYETTTPYFGDIGSNITDENGYCKIEIEQLFSQTIEDDDYKVFIQKCGQGDLYVIKHKKYFEVKGTPNLDFDWEIKAVQKGYKDIRLKEKER